LFNTCADRKSLCILILGDRTCANPSGFPRVLLVRAPHKTIGLSKSIYRSRP
jgi:hypothetical protein